MTTQKQITPTNKTNKPIEKIIQEPLISVTCDIDPEVTKTAIQIQNAINEMDEINKNPETQRITKPIQPTGRVITSKNTPSPTRLHIENMQKMEDEANSDNFISPNTRATIEKIASQNPVIKKLIDEAKLFTTTNREEIYKQCTDIVALYNISHKKPFFFITPAEARLAIDYIKKCRDGYVADLENEHERDMFIHNFMQQIKINRDINITNLPDALDVKITEQIQNDLDKLCGLEMGEPTTDEKIKLYKEYNAEAFESSDKSDKFQELENINIALQDEETKQIPQYYVYNVKTIHHSNYNKNDYTLSLNLLNQMFSILEYNDLFVDVILMNSFRIADVRNFGKTVYAEYSKKDMIRRKVTCKIFTAEIYPCNKLADNQLIFGSIIPAKPNKGIFLNVFLDTNLTK